MYSPILKKDIMKGVPFTPQHKFLTPKRNYRTALKYVVFVYQSAHFSNPKIVFNFSILAVRYPIYTNFNFRIIKILYKCLKGESSSRFATEFVVEVSPLMILSIPLFKLRVEHHHIMYRAECAITRAHTY